MFYFGMDVAKAKLDCCLLLDETSGKRKTKVVSNTPAGYLDLLAWVAKQHIAPAGLNVIMEATGVYHEPVAHALTQAEVRVSIINPAQVKAFGQGLAVRTKTDGADSFVLAHYLNPPPGHLHRLRREPCKPCWHGARRSLKTCNANAIGRGYRHACTHSAVARCQYRVPRQTIEPFAARDQPTH